MFERLFHYPGVLMRHREAPLLAERENFLQHCANQGTAQSTLAQVANELLIIVRRLDVSAAERSITRQQVEVAAERWARHQRRRGRCHGLRWSRERFTRTATAWLGFIGRLEMFEPRHSAGEEWIEPFAAYLKDERGLSVHTISASHWHTEKFFARLAAQNRTLTETTIADVDAFLESLGEQGWCRVSIAKSAKMLRAFFHYAEHREDGVRLVLRQASWDRATFAMKGSPSALTGVMSSA